MPLDAREPLRKLAASTEPYTLRRLWRALSTEDRESAVNALLTPDDPDGDTSASFLPVIVRLVAEAKHFRVQTVEKFSIEKLARAVARIPLEQADLIDPAVRALHTGQRRLMLSEFYTVLGISHEDGIADLFSLPKPAARPLETARAADVLLRSFPADEVLTFAIALSILYPEQFPALREWCGQAASGTSPVTEPAPGLRMATQSAPEVQPVPTDTYGFTTLDRRMIVSIVGSAGQAIGALDEDELDDLLLEVLKLNESRHQTWFHVGYRDVLFRRQLGDAIAAENEPRRVWYWAGVVTGLARESRWKDIAALFDERSGVREIGSSTNGAERAAAWVVFRALDEAGRVAEAREFLRVGAVANSDELRQQLLATATRLIRENRASEARPLLERLWEACEFLVESGPEPRAAFMRELRRRRAGAPARDRAIPAHGVEQQLVAPLRRIRPPLPYRRWCGLPLTDADDARPPVAPELSSRVAWLRTRRQGRNHSHDPSPHSRRSEASRSTTRRDSGCVLLTHQPT